MKKSHARMSAVGMLAGILTAAMTLPVFAEIPRTGALTADGTISVTHITEGDTAKAYQIVKWNQTSGKWELNSELGLTDKTFDDIFGDKVISTEEAKMLALAAASHVSPIQMTMTGTKAEADVSDMGGGIFYVLVTPGEGSRSMYNPIFVSSDFTPGGTNTIDAGVKNNYDSKAIAKKTDLTLDKKSEPAKNGEAELQTNDDNANKDVQVGSIIPFTINSNVPTYLENYTNPFYQISDTLSEGLVLEGDPSVAVDGYTLTASDYTVVKNQNGKGFTMTFSQDFLKKVVGNPEVTVAYSAKVASDAVYTVNPDKNTATLEYSNNPEDENSHGTLEDHTHHYSFSLDGKVNGETDKWEKEVWKIGLDANGEEVVAYQTTKESKDLKPLAGAEFQLRRSDSSWSEDGEVVGTYTTTDNGLIQFNGLDAGRYILEETSAPGGYVKDPHKYKVEIKATYTTAADDSADGWDTTLSEYSIIVDGHAANYAVEHTNGNTESIGTVTRRDDSMTTPVNNKPGTELPSTGGIGTTVFYTLGILMIGGAAVVLTARKKSNDD